MVKKDKQKDKQKEKQKDKQKENLERQEAETQKENSETQTEAQEIKEKTEVNLEDIIMDQERQRADLQDKLLRSMAEFENFRKRTLKEMSAKYYDGVKDTLEKLLPVVDNLERALAYADERESPLYKGIEMTSRQFFDILSTIGVEPLPGVGNPFDPNIHDAVAHVEDNTVGENIIVEEMQKGYRFKEKVLRPSMVKVAN